MELEEWLKIYQAVSLTSGVKERSYWTILGIFLLTNGILILSGAFLALTYTLHDARIFSTASVGSASSPPSAGSSPNTALPEKLSTGRASCGTWRESSPERNFTVVSTSCFKETKSVSLPPTGYAMNGTPQWGTFPGSPAPPPKGCSRSFRSSFYSLGSPWLSPAG